GGLMQLKAYFTKNSAATLLLFHSRTIYYPASEQGRSNSITATLTLQPSDNLLADGSWIYADFFRDSDDAKLYGYAITRLKLTYQLNQYLFFRGIAEYNENKTQLTTDFLASFTYIPGTALYMGYGSVFTKVSWDGNDYVPNNRLIEMQRGLFFKMSYLWRS
ncbi:MAG TPA: hypothetical protein VJ508_20515, partial [Saprospiraceae bacterium]|nr:hypothetical protein [Saprospiraceae bacterium]